MARSMMLVVSSMIIMVTCMVIIPSSTDAAVYNESLAKVLTMYSAAAYTDHPTRCQNAFPLSYKVLNTFNGTLQGQTIFGYIGVDQASKQIVVAYRGSANAGQLIQELTMSNPMTYPGQFGQQVLSYFMVAYGLLTNSTRAYVANLVQLFPGYQVVITGHSLGGCIATLAAYDLVLTGIVARPLVYTFGEPRTGNRAFAQAVMSKVPDIFRVTHYRDIVPHIPPCNTTFEIMKLTSVCTAGDPDKGFWSYHHGTEIWYGQEYMPNVFTPIAGQYKTCTGTPLGEDSSCANSLTFTTSIDNHRSYFNVSVGIFCPESVMNLPPFLGGGSLNDKYSSGNY